MSETLPRQHMPANFRPIRSSFNGALRSEESGNPLLNRRIILFVRTKIAITRLAEVDAYELPRNASKGLVLHAF